MVGFSPGMGASSFTTAQPKEAREHISSVVGEIGEQLDRLNKVLAHLDSIGDVLAGSAPQEVTADDPETPPISVIDNLRRKRRTLGMLITRCETAANRIENAIR